MQKQPKFDIGDVIKRDWENNRCEVYRIVSREWNIAAHFEEYYCDLLFTDIVHDIPQDMRIRSNEMIEMFEKVSEAEKVIYLL